MGTAPMADFRNRRQSILFIFNCLQKKQAVLAINALREIIIFLTMYAKENK